MPQYICLHNFLLIPSIAYFEFHVMEQSYKFVLYCM